MSLDEFVENDRGTGEVTYRRIRCYMRKGRRIVDDEMQKALTIANITNHACPRNERFDPNHKPTGMFREFERLVREAALKHGYDGVFVENIANEFLPAVLIRYGYRAVNNFGGLLNNYWIPVGKSNE